MTGGLFVTFEGGDGVGKTTQAALLEEWLTAEGATVVRTREPGGTEVGVLVRDIVLHHRGEVAPRAEALLYAADRAHHIETVVRPALARGEVVIQDRYLDSSVAYQGAGRVLGRDEVRDLSLWATGGTAARPHGAARPRSARRRGDASTPTTSRSTGSSPSRTTSTRGCARSSSRSPRPSPSDSSCSTRRGPPTSSRPRSALASPAARRAAAGRVATAD